MEFRIFDVGKFANLLELTKKTVSGMSELASRLILLESTPEYLYCTVSSREVYIRFRIDGEMAAAGKATTTITDFSNFLTAIKSKKEVALLFDGSQLFVDADKASGTFDTIKAEIAMNPYKKWDISEEINFDLIAQCQRMIPFLSKTQDIYKQVQIDNGSIFATDTYKILASKSPFEIFKENFCLNAEVIAAAKDLSKFEGEEIKMHKNDGWAGFELGAILIAVPLSLNKLKYNMIETSTTRKDSSYYISFNAAEMLDGLKIIASIGKEEVQAVHVNLDAKQIQILNRGENSATAEIPSLKSDCPLPIALDRTSLDVVSKTLLDKENPVVNGYINVNDNGIPVMLCLKNELGELAVIMIMRVT